MNPGKYRHIITIEQATGTQDEYGAETKTWSEFAKLWAEIYTKKTTEHVVNDKITPVSMVILRTRYKPGITEAMRIVKGSTVYEILGINNIEERNITLEFTCKKNG